MSVHVSCPNCNRKLRIEDEFVGKKVRCPDCKSVFVGDPSAPKEAAESITASRSDKPVSRKVSKDDSGDNADLPKKKPKRKAPDDEEEVEGEEEGDEGAIKKPKRLKPSEARRGWRGIRLALSLLIWGLNTWLTVTAILFVGFILLAILGLVAAKAGGGAGIFGVLGVLMILLYAQYFLGSLATFILYAIGHGFLWQTPNQPGSGLRPLAIATMALFFGAIVLVCGGYAGTCVLSSVDGRLGLPVYFCSAALAYLGAFAWFFVFWIYMRFICLEARNTVLARTPLYFMIVFPIYNFVVPIVLGLFVMLAGASFAAVAPRDPSSAFNAGGAMFVVVAVCWLTFFIIDWCLLLWSSFILQNVRTAVEGLARR